MEKYCRIKMLEGQRIPNEWEKLCEPKKNFFVNFTEWSCNFSRQCFNYETEREGEGGEGGGGEGGGEEGGEGGGEGGG